MAGYSSSGTERDPINKPHQIPLDEWHSFSLVMVAECKGCGRTREVHRGELVRRFGYGMCFSQAALDDLAPKLRCVHCERRAPVLSLRVVPSGQSVSRL